MGDELSQRGRSLRPLAQSRGGSRGDSTWDGRGSARRQAVQEGGRACGGSARACRGSAGTHR
jgi:hypothetical protein